MNGDQEYLSHSLSCTHSAVANVRTSRQDQGQRVADQKGRCADR